MPLSFDLRRAGYLRGPDHRNPARLEQLATSSKEHPVLTQKLRSDSDSHDGDVASSYTGSPLRGRADSDLRRAGYLRGPDHRNPSHLEQLTRL
jgi:hypothetical protein